MKASDVSRCQHAGIALATVDPPPTGKTWLDHLLPFTTLRSPRDYGVAAARWARLSAGLPGVVQRQVTTSSSLAIGTGNFSPVENGLTLHGTWGVPYLPGAALKGLALRAAVRFGLSELESEVIFGTTASRGYVNFDDGWLLPDPDRPLFELDVMTPHAGEYYSSQGKEAPDDSREPVPIQFLVVPKDTRFLVTLDCPESGDWAEAAMTILAFGLQKLGLGGMTSSGYGRFTVEPVGKGQS
ncbi:type III-B CRISPR module RAMP protein Cmr6 [Arachnia propionica]|uniref:Type III-B CRISPR module RAMP protein Cmr6 n=1 Tax=Arachnia propionica TaxID=1750 RepID=A0A3P1T5R0_9ACTN|nr:type III-B CRISPR module RAMP protein Cmr6 [Arachnia propionica]RRD04535.1 type III-B CRISPR module RAMP protein Cmr6 [Arachnia propionica]